MSMTTPSGQAMSWEEYERLPEDIRHEYIGGHVVVTPFPTPRHSLTINRLVTLLDRTLPVSHVAVSHVGWKAGKDEFGPDIFVMPTSDIDDVRFEGTPPLVIEVLSTHRAADTVVKVQKYARAGAPRYWMVDLRDRTLVSLILVDGVYEIAAQLDDDNPVGELDTGAGAVTISLPDLLA